MYSVTQSPPSLCSTFLVYIYIISTMEEGHFKCLRNQTQISFVTKSIDKDIYIGIERIGIYSEFIFLIVYYNSKPC